MGSEGDLILAAALKALEPAQEPPFSDSAAVNDLYYIHDRKMALLNQTVYALIKVQDLVNRLLHESLGGDLVDTSKPDWEEDELKRKNVEKGLAAKRTSGALSQADFAAISEALAIPKNTPKGKIALAYRNKLVHHIRPSVDYSLFFSSLESREGEEVRDPQGKVVKAPCRARQAARAVSVRRATFCVLRVFDAVVAMIERLSRIEIMRR